MSINASFRTWSSCSSSFKSLLGWDGELSQEICAHSCTCGCLSHAEVGYLFFFSYAMLYDTCGVGHYDGQCWRQVVDCLACYGKSIFCLFLLYSLLKGLKCWSGLFTMVRESMDHRVCDGPCYSKPLISRVTGSDSPWFVLSQHFEVWKLALLWCLLHHKFPSPHWILLFLFQGSLKEKTLENLEKYVVKDVSARLLRLCRVTFCTE